MNNFALAPENISKATNEESVNFQQIELNRRLAAQQEKADVLARLKKQDHTIPIAFFDDVDACAQEGQGEGNG